MSAAFTLLVSRFNFHESMRRNEWLGMLLVVTGILALLMY
jgi:multidrug transporter EmrE-like cation transporter